jgi:hypothetical protein
MKIKSKVRGGTFIPALPPEPMIRVGTGSVL